MPIPDNENEKNGRRGGEKVVFVTGPSGAGRATAVRALEDIGFEVIDNLPLSLMPRLLEGPSIGRPLALGLDIRNRDFSVTRLLDSIEQSSENPDLDIELLYLNCSAEVLVRRFSETRRPHPMALAETPLQGIEREFELLEPIRSRADVLIDTSDLTPHNLKAEIARWFDTSGEARLAVSVQSFSYKRGLPRGADMVFDCRFLRNPYWDADLRMLSGQSSAVAKYVEQDERFADFFEKVSDMVAILLPAFADEGKSHLSIAFGCTGGQHRSVFVVEKLANALAALGWQVSKRHWELEGRDIGSPPPSA
ncbi:MAG: RNase adapter RapZ [Marinosulfonomonas sp.]|nr:RNase adapter RapZ [Marinosulfonomonas sp.]